MAMSPLLLMVAQFSEDINQGMVAKIVTRVTPVSIFGRAADPRQPQKKTALRLSEQRREEFGAPATESRGTSAR